MEDDNDYWDHRRPGLQKALCAWGVLAVVAVLLGIAGLAWPNAPQSLSFTAAQVDLALRARRAFDKEHLEDFEFIRQADDLDSDDFDRRVAFGDKRQ